jgi:hypothetical protein
VKKELVDSAFLALDRKKIEYRYPYHEKNDSICRLWNTSWLARTISLSQSKIYHTHDSIERPVHRDGLRLDKLPYEASSLCGG